MLTVDQMIERLHWKGHRDIISMWFGDTTLGFCVTWNLENGATVVMNVPNKDQFWRELIWGKLAEESGGDVDTALVSYYANFISEWKLKYLYIKSLGLDTQQGRLQYPEEARLQGLLPAEKEDK